MLIAARKQLFKNCHWESLIICRSHSLWITDKLCEMPWMALINVWMWDEICCLFERLSSQHNPWVTGLGVVVRGNPTKQSEKKLDATGRWAKPPGEEDGQQCRLTRVCPGPTAPVSWRGELPWSHPAPRSTEPVDELLQSYKDKRSFLKLILRCSAQFFQSNETTNLGWCCRSNRGAQRVSFPCFHSTEAAYF